MKSDFRYSNFLVYSNYPFPPAPTEAQRPAVTDRAVDRCYRPQPFASVLARLEFLFGLYQQLSAPVLGAAPKTRAKPRITA